MNRWQIEHYCSTTHKRFQHANFMITIQQGVLLKILI